MTYGERYGNTAWTVLSEAAPTRDKRGRAVRRVHCRCACGDEHDVYLNVLRFGRSTRCKKCGYAERSPTNLFFYNRFRRGAKARGVRWGITLKQFRALFDAQSGMCKLTGLPLVWPRNSADIQSGACTASLDRIDSAKGYTPGNVQWVHKGVNMLKGNRTDAELIAWARLIVAHADATTEDRA